MRQESNSRQTRAVSGAWSLGTLLLAATTLFGCAATRGAGEAARARSATVIVVRHAEKVDASDDSGLSPTGASRAVRLATWLAAAELTHAFATQYERTQATVRPAATAARIPIEVVDAGDTDALLDRLRALPNDAVALVAGHSNTVPAIVEGLGGSLIGLAGPGKLASGDYSRVVVLALGADGERPLRCVRSLDLRMQQMESR